MNAFQFPDIRHFFHTRFGAAQPAFFLIQGPTVETALRKAENLDAELVVVGTHGHGAVYDVLIGSYSAGIIRKSKRPALVVPIRDA